MLHLLVVRWPITSGKLRLERNKRTIETKLWLGFYYDADEYLEIVNNEAYTEYDLWSQIGGIVGIFLGYSILQVTLTRIQLYFQILDRIKMHWL